LGVMDRLVLSDTAWERMASLIIGRPDQGVLWIVRTGFPWRDLPEAFGDWNSVFRRFQPVERQGCLGAHFRGDVGRSGLRISDRRFPIVRAHQHAAGAKKWGSEDQALGRSRGGLSTKIHIAVRGLGCPVRFTLTVGQKGYAPQAATLIEGLPAEVVMADTAYDAIICVKPSPPRAHLLSFPTIRQGH
jgi:transposase